MKLEICWINQIQNFFTHTISKNKQTNSKPSIVQVRSQGRKEEEKEEGEHVDDDVDSINGEDE